MTRTRQKRRPKRRKRGGARLSVGAADGQTELVDDTDLKATALNGAQVTAALSIVQEVVAGTLTEAMASAMLQTFFFLSHEASAKILAGAVKLGKSLPVEEP